MDKFAEGLKSLMNNKEMVDDDEERSEGFVRIYEFFTRYVRRIHPDTHWKRAMKMNPNVVWFQLNDVRSESKRNGRGVWTSSLGIVLVIMLGRQLLNDITF